MSDTEAQTDERPCLHCLIVEQIDHFFAEYPSTNVGPDTIDADEVIIAVAKTIAELTYCQTDAARQGIIDQLAREIVSYDAEFRQEGEPPGSGSIAKH